MKILTVDDSKIIRKLVTSTVEALGYEARQAGNGAEALELLRKEPDVALVLLDWNMPVMDGLTCLQQIRADAALGDVRVMMCTTEGEAQRIALAIRSGAVNYVTKPFTPETLASKILESLGMGT